MLRIHSSSTGPFWARAEKVWEVNFFYNDGTVNEPACNCGSVMAVSSSPTAPLLLWVFLFLFYFFIQSGKDKHKKRRGNGAAWALDRLVEKPHRVFVIQLFHRFLLSISRQAAWDRRLTTQQATWAHMWAHNIGSQITTPTHMPNLCG